MWEVMSPSGIDISSYAPHSTKGAYFLKQQELLPQNKSYLKKTGVI